MNHQFTISLLLFLTIISGSVNTSFLKWKMNKGVTESSIFSTPVMATSNNTNSLNWNSYDKVQNQNISVNQLPFTLVNKANYGEFWKLGIKATKIQEIQPNSILHLHLKARTIWSDDESRRAIVLIRLGVVNAQGQRKILYQQTIPFSLEGNDFYMPVKVPPDITGREVFVDLQIGQRPQTLEIVDGSIVVYPSDTDITTLARYQYTWPGRELDAPWRKAAYERIEQIRKAPLKITVRNADGTPAANTKVHVQMQDHAFAWGTMIPYFYVFGSRPTRQQDWYHTTDAQWIAKYHTHLRHNFNWGVNGLLLKWPQLDRFGEDRAEEYFTYLKSIDMKTRGHTLIWPKWRFIHRDIRQLKNDPEALRAAVEHRVRSVTKRFGPLIDEWDVLNEPVTRTDLQDILGEEILVDIFKWTHEEDPTARLYINNFGILTGIYNDNMHDGYEQLISMLIDNKAPLGGIGMQGHLAGDVTPPETLLAILDRFAKFNLPIRITEYSHLTPNQEEKDDYLRDFMTAIFSHQAVDGFIFWGFVSMDDGQKQGLYDSNWEETSKGAIYRDLVFNQWWTDVVVTTDSNGQAIVHGFLGDYELQVMDKHRIVKSISVQLSKPGTETSIDLPCSTPSSFEKEKMSLCGASSLTSQH